MSKPNKGFLTDYERDVLLMYVYDNGGHLMNHLGISSLGSVDFYSMEKRKHAREHPPVACCQYNCDKDVVCLDFEIKLDGKGYCSNHRPQEKGE